MSEEEIRLDQTKKVFEVIANIIANGSCTYRYLIYDMLGFKTENYIDLMSGLTITNAIVDLEDFQRENKRLKEVIEEVRKLRNQFIEENELFCFENNCLINLMNKLLQILDKVKNV